MIPTSVQNMQLAAKQVGEVKSQQAEKWQKSYGTLCHNFPVMALQCGLCQTVAFYMEKSKGDHNTPHGRILKDVDAILGGAHRDVHTMTMMEYVVATRRILAAWVYYKRFAVSILGAEPGGDPS